ncbi:hypothetical protein ABZW03_28325 [Kitasatospora sp. NPDC004799]|uniref:hypothetical protein n=1 Tax=Kitasatospora sp. NPDC004799 TaxID=3154460 RepID=UPI0033BD50B1
MPGTHPWFGVDSPPAGRTLSTRQVREVLRHELRDCGTRLQSDVLALQPLLATREAYDELFTSARGLLRLLERAVREAAGDRAGRLAALGTDEVPYPFFVADEDFEMRYAASMARPDVVIGPDGPKFLEFNVSGTFGGPAEIHLFTHAWTRIYGGPGVAPFSGHEPFAARAELYRRVCTELGLPLGVALLGSRLDRPGAQTARYYEVEAEYFRQQGLAAEFVEPADLEGGPGTPRGAGRDLAYPLLHRYFAIDDWRKLGISLDPVHRAVQRGSRLFPPQSSYLVANKKVLAWISEGRPWMTEEDRALVERCLPWTRLVYDRKLAWGGRRHDLADLLLDNQQHFVLKKAIGMMGLEVTLGPYVTGPQWRGEVARALAEGDTIVQQYVEPGRFRMAMSSASGPEVQSVDIAPVLSPVLFGGVPAGCWARYHGSGQAGMIGASGFGATENVLLATGGPHP